MLLICSYKVCMGFKLLTHSRLQTVDIPKKLIHFVSKRWTDIFKLRLVLPIRTHPPAPAWIWSITSISSQQRSLIYQASFPPAKLPTTQFTFAKNIWSRVALYFLLHYRQYIQISCHWQRAIFTRTFGVVHENFCAWKGIKSTEKIERTFHLLFCHNGICLLLVEKNTPTKLTSNGSPRKYLVVF